VIIILIYQIKNINRSIKILENIYKIKYTLNIHL